MKLFGLIGFPLGHSFSKKYFTEKFRKENIEGCKYELFPIEDINLLNQLLINYPDLIGLNVTIPYKEKVLEYIDELDDTAASIKAVNCIRIYRKTNKINLKGYNTDCYGFETSLKPLLKPWHKKALVLGTGGASKAVEYILEKFNIQCNYVSRTPRENIFGYDQLNESILKEYKLIINGSPVGMSPNIDQAPALPYEYLTKDHLLYDLGYNPEETLFMKKGIAQGAKVINGLPMLIGQAEKAWEIWNSKS